MGSARKKVISYRCAGAVDLEAHTLHWTNFEWAAGSVQVTCSGPWGSIQVWAASEAEARRVIAHAHAIAGWPSSDVAAAEWAVRTVSGGRWGKPGVCRLRRSGRGYAVRTREGPDGPPLHAWMMANP